jgi:hypothetical protein
MSVQSETSNLQEDKVALKQARNAMYDLQYALDQEACKQAAL